MDRFKRPKLGSYYATNTAEKSCFLDTATYQAKAFHKPRIPSKEEIPIHRPLWQVELRKEVPTGAQFEIESAFGSKNTLLKSRATVFKNNYSKYSKTCDIQKDIKIYLNDSNFQ